MALPWWVGHPVMAQSAPQNDWSQDMQDQFRDHLYKRFVEQTGVVMTAERKELFAQLAHCIVQKIVAAYSPAGFEHLSPREAEDLCKKLLVVCSKDLHVSMEKDAPVL